MTHEAPRSRMPGDEPTEIDELAGYLNALAHPSRLELLSQLRTPRTVREIHLRPHRAEQEGNPDRAITRTAVERHLLLLRAIGVVASRPGERDGRKVDEYLLQRARLFQVTERLRDLMHLRPIEDLGVDQTLAGGHAPRAAAPAAKGPTLTVLTGPDEGRSVAVAKRCSIGRDAANDLALDYDPYVSAQQCVLAAGAAGFTLTSSTDAKNPTFIDWTPMKPGETRALAGGEVIKLGRSLVLFRG